MIVGALAQNWRQCETYVDVRRERMSRWASQTPEMRAVLSDPGNASSEPPIAASSTALIHLGTAVAVVGGLAWVGQLIVFLANVELYLPRRVRESMALGLLALLLAVAAICLLCLTRAH